MAEEYKESDISKEVKRLMDEEGYEFGEAVKEAMGKGMKDGGLMVAIQKFNQGGRAYNSRATVEDMAKAIQTSSGGTDNQKLRMLMDYSLSMDPQATPQTVMANQGKMENLLGLQTNPNFNYMKPSDPGLIMPPMVSTGFRQDPGSFGNEGIIINGKRYMSEDEAIEDMGIETYNRFMAKGGMAGGKTYHQYHDQFIPRDEESMGYANGGGVGTMMVPRQNYANGGVYRGGGADYFEPLGYDEDESITVEDLTVPSRVGDFRVSASKPLDDQSGLISATPNVMNQGVQTIEGSLIPGDKRMDFADARRAMTQPGLTDQATVYDPYGIKVEDGRFSYDMNKTSVDDFKPSGQGYEDLIMNPDGVPNALQNLERFADNRFEDLDFQEGFDFIDAPNKVTNLKELYQNRNYLNNPRKGFIDNTILSRGNPDASLLNKTKNKLTDLFSGAKEGIMNTGQKFKEGAGIIMGPVSALASFRNPLNPKASNYNPDLAGQLNALNNMTGTVTSGSTTFMSPEDIKAGKFGTKSGAMLVTDPNTGLTKYGPGSVLSGQNAISGFGTNDYMGQLEKELEKMQNRAKKKSLTAFQQKKQQDILNEIQREKDRQAAVAEAAAAESRAESRRQYNPAVHGPNNYGLGSDGKQSYDSGQGFGVNATTGGPVSNRTGRGRTDYKDGGIVSLRR